MRLFSGTMELADPSAANQDGPLAGSKLAWLFLGYALPMMTFLAIAMAPFQVADELCHCMRAVQVGQGDFVSGRLGGMVDGGMAEEGKFYESMWFHPEVKQTVALARRAGSIAWHGVKKWGDFCNTVQYGPFLYLPQALGMRIGQFAGLSVARTVVLARLLNGLSACLVGFAALTICRRGRALMFMTLLLPMTISEIGSAAQDALIITLSLLVAATASRVLSEQRPARIGEFLLFAFVVMATTMARPTQIALVLLTPAFLSWNDPGWRLKILIGLAAAVPIFYWSSLLGKLMPIWPRGVSVVDQFDLILSHPLTLARVIKNSFLDRGVWYLKTVIGHLGWTDTPMPGWYYGSAAAVMVLALIANGNRGRAVLPALLGLATFLGLMVAQFAALYLTWTPLGAAKVDGFQGRYLLPVLPLLGWVLPGWPRRLEVLGKLTWYPVLLFPVVTLATLPRVIMVRYYGSWAEMGNALNALLLP